MNPSSPVQVQSLAPGQTERTSLPISRGELNPELLSTDQVQVALKSSLGVAMFFVPLPVHAILSPDGRLEKTNYLQVPPTSALSNDWHDVLLRCGEVFRASTTRTSAPSSRRTLAPLRAASRASTSSLLLSATLAAKCVVLLALL